MTMNAFQSKPKKVQRHYAGQAGRWAGALLLTALLTACARITLGPAPTPTTARPTQAPPTARPNPTQTPRVARASLPTPTAISAARSAAITDLVGGVEARPDIGGQFGAAVLGQVLQTGAGVRTDDTGQATLELSEGSIIRVDRATSFELRDLSGDAGSPSTTLGLDLGRVLVFAAQVLGVTGFDVQTPAGVASVRGSYFSVAYDPATASIIVTCLESSDNCTFTAGPNTVTLHNGQSLIVDQQNFVLRVVDVSYEELQEFLALFPEAAEVLATAFPNGTPTPGASPTPTPLPTATDTNTPAAPALPVIILPTATFTPAPTQTPTPLPTNTERPERPAAPTATCVPSGTVPCPTP